MAISRHRKCRASKEVKLQRCLAAASAFITLRECLALCSSSHFLSEGTEVNQLTPPTHPHPFILHYAALLLCYPSRHTLRKCIMFLFFSCNVKSSRAHIALMSLHDVTASKAHIVPLWFPVGVSGSLRQQVELSFRVETAARIMSSLKTRVAI